jgi:hypothetical protein
MSDFEQRLRATVVERSEGFEPSADLPDRITARVRRRRVRRQVAAGGLVAAAAAVVVVVGVVATGGGDEGSIRMSGGDPVVTTPESTVPDSATTTAADPSTTAPPPSSTGPAIDVLTPLNRQGIGPIRAGMTLREAQGAGGVTLVPSGPNDSGTCAAATFEGLEPSVSLMVEIAGPDAMDGVVRAVLGSVLPTEEGAIVGQSRDELLAALGPPTRTEEAAAELGENAQLLVFEAGGFAYGALVADDMVLTLLSGDPAWVSDAAGCPL